LIGLRNGLTYVANFTVLGFALIMFATVEEQTLQFGLLCWFIIVLGILTSVFYDVAVPEVQLREGAKTLEHE